MNDVTVIRISDQCPPRVFVEIIDKLLIKPDERAGMDDIRALNDYRHPGPVCGGGWLCDMT